MKRLILMAIIALMASCTTQRKVDKWVNNNPMYLANKCATEFPVKEGIIKGKTDTVTEIVTDTVKIKMDCPPDKEGKVVTLECPPNEYIYKYIHSTDTLLRENTAQTAIERDRADKYEKKYNDESKKRESAEDRSSLYFKIILGLGAALGIGGFFFFRR